MPRSGADLALLMLGAFRSMADAATAELAARGYEDVRPVHDFALRAVAAGADSTSELGRRTSVTKQAAAKTVAVLEERGYLAREADPADARRARLRVTDRGLAMLREGDAVFEELRARWAQRVGTQRLDEVEATLTELVGAEPVRLDAPGWVAQDVGGTS